MSESDVQDIKTILIKALSSIKVEKIGNMLSKMTVDKTPVKIYRELVSTIRS